MRWRWNFAAECPRGQRGRPLSEKSIEDMGGEGICEKENRLGRKIYYRTPEGRQKHKEKSEAKATELLKKRVEGPGQVRGRKPQVFVKASALVAERLGRGARTLDEFIDTLRSIREENELLAKGEDKEKEEATPEAAQEAKEESPPESVQEKKVKTWELQKDQLGGKVKIQETEKPTGLKLLLPNGKEIMVKWAWQGQEGAGKYYDARFKDALSLDHPVRMKDGKEGTHMRVHSDIAKEIKDYQATKKQEQLKKELHITKEKYGRYILSHKISPEMWSKIAPHMEKISVETEASEERYRRNWDEEERQYTTQWAVKNGKEDAVEAALGIVPEQRRKERELRLMHDEEAYKQRRERQRAAKEDIKKHFVWQEATKPEKTNKNELLQMPQGEVIVDDMNIYGGGEKWIIENDKIWHIQNNGMDGDDWSYNNIRTGGAGAIGRYWERTPEKEKAVRALRP